MQTENLDNLLQINSIKSTSIDEKIHDCINENLMHKNIFQMSILELAGYVESQWAEFLLEDDGKEHLSTQMRRYYCLNICPNRSKCENAENLDWINQNIDYPATFLDKVYVIPVRNNPEKFYDLFKIH